MNPQKVSELLFGRNPRSEDVEAILKMLLADYLTLMSYHLEEKKRKKVFKDAEKVCLIKDLLDMI